MRKTVIESMTPFMHVDLFPAAELQVAIPGGVGVPDFENSGNGDIPSIFEGIMLMAAPKKKARPLNFDITHTSSKCSSAPASIICRFRQ